MAQQLAAAAAQHAGIRQRHRTDLPQPVTDTERYDEEYQRNAQGHFLPDAQVDPHRADGCQNHTGHGVECLDVLVGKD